MNLLKAWNAKLEAASFLLSKILYMKCVGEHASLTLFLNRVIFQYVNTYVGELCQKNYQYNWPRSAAEFYGMLFGSI